MSEHQIDAVVRKAASTLDRRGSLKALGTALVAGFALGKAPWLVTAKGSKGKRKGKGKGNKNKPKKPRNRCLAEPESCSGGACDTEPEWVGDQCEINHCEFICRQCDGDDNGPFCIRNGLKPDGTPTKVAVCCLDGESCCGSECADFESDPAHCGTCFERCRPLELCDNGECQCPANMEACPNDFNGCCLPGDFCDVFGCESGDCPISCQRPERCCHQDGQPRCVDPKTNMYHCGACGKRCAPNESCNNGSCETPDPCPPPNEWCGLSCISPSQSCCAAGEAACLRGYEECCPLPDGTHRCTPLPYQVGYCENPI